MGHAHAGGQSGGKGTGTGWCQCGRGAGRERGREVPTHKGAGWERGTPRSLIGRDVLLIRQGLITLGGINVAVNVSC